MTTTRPCKSLLRLVALSLCLIFTAHAHAWVAAGHGGYYHGGGGGYYYGNGWASHGVVIGVPEGAYYGYGCGMIQRCYPNGGCVNERVCE